MRGREEEKDRKVSPKGWVLNHLHLLHFTYKIHIYSSVPANSHDTPKRATRCYIVTLQLPSVYLYIELTVWFNSALST